MLDGRALQALEPALSERLAGGLLVAGGNVDNRRLCKALEIAVRRAGVTLELLWSEYQQAVADGGTGRRAYQYSQFCELYRGYRKKLSPVMRSPRCLPSIRS